jgi:ribosomal protein S12 methylthiotransferase
MSLGCDKNRVDAEIMAAALEDGGYELTDDIGEADLAVVNTCGFIESAKQESIDAIFEAVRHREEDGHPEKILVTGCLSQRYFDEISDEIPEADGFLTLAGNSRICEAADRVLSGERVKISEGTLPSEGRRVLSTPPHIAYVKIAEGCSNRCAYCAIPMIRGKYRSRPQESVVNEVKELVNGGAEEIILVAQDTSAYGMDLHDGTSLAGLLEELDKIDGIWKVRVLYTYLDRIDDRLLDVIAGGRRIAKYLDIPLQHCSGEVLRRMHRPGDRKTLTEKIKHIRDKVPGITLRSTFMVGFPGETDRQFDELLNFLEKMRFERAGFFSYSREEGTEAAEFEDQIPEETKKSRLALAEDVQAGVLADLQSMKAGTEAEAICDGFDGDAMMYSLRTESDAPDVDTCRYALGGEKELAPGDIVRVKILSSDGADLYGEF